MFEESSDLARTESLFTIVTPTRDLARFQEASRFWANSMRDVAFDFRPIINPPNLPQVYNEILTHITTPYVVFAHDDCFPLQVDGYTIGKRLAEHMEAVDVAGFVGSSHLTTGSWMGAGWGRLYGSITTPLLTATEHKMLASIYGIPAKRVVGMRTIDGMCIVMKTAVAKGIGFDPTFAFHFYDLDICSSAFDQALRTAVLCDIHMTHLSPGKFDHAWNVSRGQFEKKWAGKCDLHDTSLGGQFHVVDAAHNSSMLLRLNEITKFVPEEVVVRTLD